MATLSTDSPHTPLPSLGTRSGRFQDFEMTQPLLTRHSMLLAVIAVAQALMPALIAIASLYATLAVSGRHIEPSASDIVILGALCWLWFQPSRPARDRPLPSRRSTVLDVALRWLLLVTMWCLIDRLVGDSPLTAYPKALLLPWAGSALVAMTASALGLQAAKRRCLGGAVRNRSAIIAGYNSGSVKLARRLKSDPGMRLSVAGFFDDRSDDHLTVEPGVTLLGALQDLGAYVKAHRTDVIFVALPNREVQRVMDLMDDLRDTTASIYYVPDALAVDRLQPRSLLIQGMPVIAIGETPFYGYRGVGKRLTDVVLTLGLLALLLPVMLLIAVAIELTSPGSLVDKQRRYGMDGRQFNIYRFSTRNRLGTLLRRTSLDELPQLINVLQGRMSLVGPQPHTVDHSEAYRKLIKGYMVRSKVPPGITGLAQVSGARGESGALYDIQQRVNLDLEYLRKWSPLLDLKILGRSIAQAFRRERDFA